KPAFAIPNFVPVTFEVTILCTALGMVAIFFYRNHLFPGRAPRVMDFRATDDRFVIAIDAKENTDHNQIEPLFEEAGAIDVLHNERKYVSCEYAKYNRICMYCCSFSRRCLCLWGWHNPKYWHGIFSKYV